MTTSSQLDLFQDSDFDAWIVRLDGNLRMRFRISLDEMGFSREELRPYFDDGQSHAGMANLLREKFEMIALHAY